MKIVTYRDLELKDGLLPLMDHAFRWPFNQRIFEDFIKNDPRSRGSPIGFCAVENGLLVGYVGVLHLSTRTLDGSVERVGGIYGVATLPSHVRKGISTTLMKRAHEYFAEKGFRFSFFNDESGSHSQRVLRKTWLLGCCPISKRLQGGCT